MHNPLHAPIVAFCIRTPKRENTEARNSRMCSCYPLNATIVACSGFILVGEYRKIT